jgi:hypothetical protein
MQFSQFPQANDVLRAAPGTEHYVQDLPIFRQQPYVISCIDFDEDERLSIAQAGRVYVQVVGDLTQHLDYLRNLAVLSSFGACIALESALYAGFEGTNAFFSLEGREVPVFIQPVPGQVLPVDSQPCAVVGFALTDADVAALMETGKLYVRVMGQTHPPIAVHASSPIVFDAPAPAEA